jgi:hypothetical protein
MPRARVWRYRRQMESKMGTVRLRAEYDNAQQREEACAAVKALALSLYNFSFDQGAVIITVRSEDADEVEAALIRARIAVVSRT